MIKRYVVPDTDFVYTRNETPDPVNNIRKRPGNRSRSPYESIDIDDFIVDNVNSNEQASAATSPTAILNADQQRFESAAPANDNTDQDIADLHAVPTKKKKNREPQEAPTPETHIYDNNTEKEHMENNLYQSGTYDNEEFVDDEMFVVENDLYDQTSVVL